MGHDRDRTAVGQQFDLFGVPEPADWPDQQPVEHPPEPPGHEPADQTGREAAGQSGPEPAGQSGQPGIDRFVGLVRRMLDRADFLLPWVAGQRQFREDNYQMASAAQLEDLFFDTFGTYLRENHPDVQLRRRSGKETWDYGLDDLLLSHKENMQPGFAVWWTGGTRVGNRYEPVRDTWRYEHSVVLVYAGIRGSLRWTAASSAAAPDGEGSQTGRFAGNLGLQKIKKRAITPGRHDLVLARPISARELEVTDRWVTGAWEDLSFHDMWPRLGGDHIATQDLWLATPPKSRRARPGAAARPAEVLTLDAAPLLPGVYVLPAEDLQELPLVANNRAHSVDERFVEGLMRRAVAAGRFVPVPLWFAHFADAQPPNLYSIQRQQFEALFAARRRR
ncbi:hypothetical protein MF406_02000 [Georgenia sp. TF02-10]|uniref:hypothetical protein n=1 Tax=Georgenia sp. TF02-10 TaxID=2917725 RepID=UPI001FA702D4|nr:hypothetical protein [Georgenia sp. TF02-10]UNX55083.1 hypothetical protein MF406_02000 [Georgenia sp. TF02-10]